MQVVADSAREIMQEAAARLAAARNRLEQKQQKLRELEHYRDEYLQALLHKSRQGMNVVQIRDYNTFLERLNEAIRQQHDIIDSLRREVERCLQQWRAAQTRCSTLDQVVAGKRQAERQTEARALQKEENEFATRSWRRGAG
jgi:flagellar FliJ protein